MPRGLPNAQERVPAIFTVDREHDVGYVKLSEKKIGRTVSLHPSVLIDVAADGEIVGVEFLKLRWDGR